jgi:hypothetical protein
MDGTKQQSQQRRRSRNDGQSKPTILIGVDEELVINKAVDAIKAVPNVYQRGGILMQVVQGAKPPRGIDRPKEAPQIAPIKTARLRTVLSSAATWLETIDRGETSPAHPPQWAVLGVEASPEWPGVRRLEGVVESPILRADGTILQAPGYDEETGLYYQPVGPVDPIPERPTHDDAQRAAHNLLEATSDFPFASHEHQATWLAAAITPAARYAYHGPAPLFLVDANVRGVGKTLLTDVISLVTLGRPMARMSAPSSDEEFRKRITAMALAGDSAVLIDNIAGSLGCASLDAALTATTWSDRRLQRSEMVSNIPLSMTWFGTGNNIILRGDTARRTSHIRLESRQENPEERADFQHADLLGWVRKERHRLAAIPATILAAYCAAGRPSMNLKPWGSFEGWSGLVRQAVVWCGLPDPAATRKELAAQADVEANAFRGLLAGWEELAPAGTGVTVAELISALERCPDKYEMLRSSLIELVPLKDGKFPARSLGMKLLNMRGRVAGGLYLENGDKEASGRKWYLRRA